MSGKPQRLISLLAVLQARRFTTAQALAEEFGVSIRTILRDIQALVDADIPVLTERGKYGGISLPPGSQVDLSKLTVSEADIFRAVGLDLGRASQLGAEAAARSAAGKLAASRRMTLPGDPPLSLADVVVVENRGWFATGQALEARREITVTALLDADRVDLARRVLGSRLRSVASGNADKRSTITIAYDQLDAVRQLLQFGDHIEVVEPAAARRLVRTLAEQIARAHGSPPGRLEAEVTE